MKKLFLTIMTAAVLLTGCSQVETQPFCRVVTEITVTRSDGSRRCYTDQGKMRTVLTYLRGLDPYDSSDADPQAVSGTEYRIEVCYSDGNGMIYHQKADRYLQINGQNWQTLNPEKAAVLTEIFETTPGD